MNGDDGRGTTGGLTIAFVGYASSVTEERASAYEDEVLAVLEDLGGRVLFRGRRCPGQDDGLPLEVQILWFPSTAVFDAYLADPRRQRLIAANPDVFTAKHSVEIDTITAL